MVGEWLDPLLDCCTICADRGQSCSLYEKGENLRKVSPCPHVPPTTKCRPSFLGVVQLLEEPIKVAEIAAKIFGVVVEYEKDATPKQKRIARSNAYRVVHNQRKAGRFPRPSYTLPGQRAESVWLLATIKKWQSEYLALCPKTTVEYSTLDRYAHLKKCNAAAMKATKIAEAYDADLMAKLFHAPRDGVRDAVTQT